MQKLPPLRALQAFEAVARHRSFKAAAAELNVTPTAISHQIRMLEQICGKALLQRRPRPLRLTVAGEGLYPALRSGFALFAEAVATVGQPGAARPLRVTSPNAFASRWLVPRLPAWQGLHPEWSLEIIGTDRVLDLAAGEADVAIRYARCAPKGLVSTEFARDTFFAVASPVLLARAGREGQATFDIGDLTHIPLIHYEWSSGDPHAPTWTQWFAAAGLAAGDSSARRARHDLNFREELHAIDAVVAGQGVALCSNVVVDGLLRSGALRKAHALGLPGFGFYVAHAAGHPDLAVVECFAGWLLSTAGTPEGEDPA
ncbi:LysR family transcriptional regulator [Cupriavidus sp. HMR-1]|uniref:LysR substrate-binding domain-containing protein n=1 Tax=Cupriavidus sp. HMR-1 TaxID=1249621 RepID=UPI0002A208B9|nr:LysR substrate-binding domain-containing protein [Cupriavidus sp. HMR-1]EKZ99814.1 LysR family transcriptional regulator [Cupriavidus sp. HMR-1]